jgi:hypothetical protein
VILCKRIRINVSGKFDNQGQSFATHHNRVSSSALGTLRRVAARHMLRVFIKIIHPLSIVIIQNLFWYDVVPCTVQVVTYVTVALPLHGNDLALPALWNSNSFYSDYCSPSQTLSHSANTRQQQHLSDKECQQRTSTSASFPEVTVCGHTKWADWVMEDG